LILKYLKKLKMNVKWLLLIILVVFCPLLSIRQETINLGDQRELFVDNNRPRRFVEER
jgi:hypothetical protein